MPQPKFYDSMAAAAAGEGISLELVRRAKRAGCTAFRGSRVHAAELLKFIAANGEELKAMSDGVSLKDKKLSEEVRKLKIKNDKDELKLVLKTDIAASISRALGGVHGILENKLVNEYPSMVVGLDVAEVRALGKKIVDAVMADCQALAKEFPE